MNKYLTAIVASSLIILSGCNDDDNDTTGGSGSGSGSTLGSETAAITSSNAETATALALDTSFNNFATGFTDAYTGVVTETEKSVINFLPETKYLLSKVKKPSSVTDSVTGITTSDTEDCLYSGETIITATTSGSDQISNGDTISVTFVNCDDGFLVMNGTMTMKFVDINNYDFDDYYHSDYSLELDVVLSALTVTIDNQDIVVNGHYTSKVVDNSEQESETIDLTSLTIDASPVVNQTMKDIKMSDVYLYSTYERTVKTSGKVEISTFDGSISYSTIEPLRYSSKYEPEPYSGSLKIQGENSSVLVNVVSSSVVELEIDNNGDDIVDNTITTNWYDLMSRPISR